MRYSVFEEAAAEASLGMREIEARLNCINAEIEQLNAKKALLKAVSGRLLRLLPLNSHASRPGGCAEPGPSADAPAPAPPVSGDRSAEADQASAAATDYSSPFPLREEVREAWLSRP